MPAPTAPTVKQGERLYSATAAQVLAALKPLDYGDKIWKWWKDRYPTASIVLKTRRGTRNSPLWYSTEQQAPPHWVKSDSAVSDVTETAFATTFATHIARIVTGTQLMNVRTKETVLVTTGDGSTTVTVKRGFGKYPPQAILAGDLWVMSLPVYKEGASAPSGVYSIEEQAPFYAAETMVSSALTWRLQATRMRIEPNTRERMIDDARYILTDAVKRSFLIGAMGNNAAAASPYPDWTGVKGVMEHCNTNTMQCTGRLTRSDLFGFTGEQVGPSNPNKVMLLATSARVINIITGWMLQNLVVNAESVPNELGGWVDQLYMIGGRRVALIEESWLSENETTSGWAFVVPVEMSSWDTVKGNGFDGTLRLYRDPGQLNLSVSKTSYNDVWYQMGGWTHGPERAYGFIEGIEY